LPGPPAAKGAPIFSFVPVAQVEQSIPVLVGSLIILVLSLGIHEAAHGWVALKCGDTTARDLGRVTLDPIVHIDPFMSIILPILLYLTGGFIFGGAKPVPVNFYNLRRPYRDMALVALAGPVSNFLIAIFLFVIWRVVVGELELFQLKSTGALIIQQGIMWNVILAAFNMLPIPPLDGSRIMAWLLPQGLRASYTRIEPFGMIIVIAFVFLFGGQALVWNMAWSMLGWIETIVSLGGVW